MGPDLQKPNKIMHFLNSCLLNIYNLLSQMYGKVTALQSSNNRKIDLYSKHKLQALTKTVVTYEQNDTLS